jgi:hypothetical protein
MFNILMITTHPMRALLNHLHAQNARPLFLSVFPTLLHARCCLTPETLEDSAAKGGVGLASVWKL